MSSQFSRMPSPWTAWMEQDDRKLVESLSGAKTPERLSYIRDIVASFYSGGHTGPGSPVQERELMRVSEKFRKWLAEKEFFEKLHSQWRQKTDDHCFALSFWLSREYLRFEAFYPALKRDTGIYPGSKLLNELPDSNHFAGQIAQPILDSFAELALNLPEHCRFSYLLHLEGLNNEEVAFISGDTLEKVTADVQLARQFLKENLGRGDYGT